ncbi:MAG: mechanosensitive ion channel family protein [Clostridia bacterium]|nr:mechanosensitive ion channel family protein [Clostridia bacterium]
MKYITDFFNNLPANFDAFCDKYLIRILVCIAVIIIFLALKFVIVAISRRIIKRLMKNKTHSDERVAVFNNIVLPPIRILLATGTLIICTYIISPPEGLRVICSKTATSLALLSLFSGLYGLCGYAKFIVGKIYEKNHVTPYNLAAHYVGIILKIAVVILGVITILQQWIANITSLLAGLSIGGVALALAAQDTAANLFGSLTVIFDHPFEIGDFIEIGAATGTVEKMGLRSTKLRRADQALVILPNSKITSEHIVNWTTISKRRIDAVLGILYSTPVPLIEKFKKGIEDILENTELVEKGNYLVTFTDYAESSLNITVRYYVMSPKNDDSLRTRDIVNLKILTLANDMGVGFAFPTRSLYIENTDKNY